MKVTGMYKLDDNKAFVIIVIVAYLTAMIVYGSIIIREWHIVDDWLKGFFLVSFVIFAGMGVYNYNSRFLRREKYE